MSQSRISPRIFLTDGPHVVEPQHVRLYNMADPERIRFVLFFRTEDDRMGYLQALRDVALDPTPLTLEQVQPEMDKARRLYDPAGVLRSGLRWWCCAQKKTYHAYKLRASVPPFNFSAMICFGEGDRDEMQKSLMAAVDGMEAEKKRVMVMAGYEGEEFVADRPMID